MSAPAKSYRTALVAVPPAALWPPLQAIRRRHDRHVRRWMPHVTLLYPFVAPDRLSAARDSLAAAAAAHEPFEVELAQFEIFRHADTATLWLRPEPERLFEALRATLEAAFPGMDDTRRYPHGFTPHLSVGQAPLDQAEALRSRLQAGWEAVRWRVEGVALLRRGARWDDAFGVDVRAPLRGR